MSSELVLFQTREGVSTLTMNAPKRLNGWTEEMLRALQSALARAASDTGTKAVVLTGSDPYYCAGVNLGATLGLDHPRRLRDMIERRNRELFELFLDFPKPILVAVNGPAIGASVTSATLCDDLIASHKATFSTPFAALGVPPEGCSSVLFARLLGETAAARMLGPEGFKPTASEALALGLVTKVVPHGELAAEAQRIAQGWVAAGRKRSFRGGLTREELREVNARESTALASAFLDPPFLEGQFRFLRSKGKHRQAAMFFALWRTRPLWSKLL
jgi:enoyl-CoA hydratase/carnithine racemase